MQSYPYIVTISSEKGGVGKTTLATNLAVYLKALREELPVTILSFDNHFTIDRMFELKGQPLKGTVHDMLMGAGAAGIIHTGQYGVGYIPPLWRPGLADGIEAVSTAEARDMARRLAREEGLFAGTSAGANVVAALREGLRLGPRARVVTLLPDSGLKYLSTELYRA